MNRVHIEFQRVQTWLFAVPRLRAMVGANALLGQALRVDLPKLARATGRDWTLNPSSSSEAYPGADDNDPLKDHDNPGDDAKDGILSRDGGHFEAQFASGAEAFTDAARELIRTNLPGLRFRVSIDNIQRTKAPVHLSTELPVLAPCEWSGRGLASDCAPQGNPKDEGYEEPHVSLDVKQRHNAALLAEEWVALDTATLLGATTKLKTFDRGRIKKMEDLVGSGYVGLIHADGNEVGKAAKNLDRVKQAAFFHRNRVLLRRAVQKAIDSHCHDTNQAPLIPLMLGGDDLLLVCRAEIALPFAVTLCEELDRIQKENNSDFKLTLGVGVVIAKHKIPIHRLHDVAEGLASSAKRRFRGFKDAGKEDCSVVDWAVYSTSWVEDPEDIRRRDWLRDNATDMRVLSQRPLNVLGAGLDSLQGLLAAAKELGEDAPRSQLRYLVDQLSRGRSLSELALAELAPEAKSRLSKAGVTAAWRRTPSGGSWITELLDLVEIYEIPRLGTKHTSSASSHEKMTEVSHV